MRGEVVHAVEGHDTRERAILGGQCVHHLSARRLAQEEDARRIDVEALVPGAHEADRLTEILELVSLVTRA